MESTAAAATRALRAKALRDSTWRAGRRHDESGQRRKKKIERQREREREREKREREREIRIPARARARERERGSNITVTHKACLALFLSLRLPHRTALAVLTLCSFVLAVAR